jgi:GDP-L-fucose synthase
MKVLITGGTGFIGRNVKEQLNGRYGIHAPSSDELDLLDESRVCEYIKRHHFDVILHSATWNATINSPKDLSKVLSNNCRMFFNIARCRRYYGKMIYYGSGAEYDRRHWIPKMREDYFDAHVPIDDYGFSKYILAKYTENSPNIYNLRLFGVFGRHEDWKIRFISNACCRAVLDMSITMKQNVFFDYMYIDDLVKITTWFIENEPKEKVYNICTGKTFDLLTLADKVIAICGKKLDITIARDGLGKEYSGDNTRLLHEMGDYVFRDMDECVSEIYHWYDTNRELIDVKGLLGG